MNLITRVVKLPRDDFLPRTVLSEGREERPEEEVVGI